MKLALSCDKDKDADIYFYIQNTNGEIMLRSRQGLEGFNYKVLRIDKEGVLHLYNGMQGSGLKYDDEYTIKIGEKT